MVISTAKSENAICASRQTFELKILLDICCNLKFKNKYFNGKCWGPDIVIGNEENTALEISETEIENNSVF